LIYRGFHRLLSTRRSSRIFGRLANAKLYPPLLRFLIRIYVKAFKIDLSEYEFDYKTVSTFNEFFTRHLKPGKREWGKGICSPVDATLLSYGEIEQGKLFQVKGRTFKEEELTGGPAFHSGSFTNLYLSPADYHRIHAPFDLTVEEVRHLPGLLLSVSEKNASNIDDLYVKNERVVLKAKSVYGPCFIVFVGALNVGSIGLTHLPDLKTNLALKNKEAFRISYAVKKGDEIGWFEMGSTVLILMAGMELSRIGESYLRQKIKMGTSLVQT
jgi:phosphatidylserine decarboxylase